LLYLFFVSEISISTVRHEYCGVIDIYKSLIITNNSLVFEKLNKTLDVELVGGGYIDVLYEVRDKIHKGAILLTHPLAGSVKPNETPYRTIIIDNVVGKLDFKSLSVIEGSIHTAKKFPVKDIVWGEKVLQDFRVIDLKLIESALSGMEIHY
jgi:hypothetical protein